MVVVVVAEPPWHRVVVLLLVVALLLVVVLLLVEDHQAQLGQPSQHPRAGHSQVLMLRQWEYDDRAMAQLVDQSTSWPTSLP